MPNVEEKEFEDNKEADCRAYLDNLSAHLVRGWAAINGIPAAVEIVVDGWVVATVCGNRYRPELVEHGIDPMSGYEHRFLPPLPAGSQVDVRLVDRHVLADGAPGIVPEGLRALSRIRGADLPCSTLICLHIPKTGGTSIAHALDATLPDRVLFYGEDQGSKLGSACVPDGTPIVFGHFGYGLHVALGLAPRYATLLREPVRRVVSFLRDIREIGRPGLRAIADVSMADAVRSRLSEQTNNFMCRVLAGVRADQGAFITDRWLLDLAWHNITRHFALVGTLAHIGLFQAHLGDLLGVELGAVREANVGRSNGGLGDGYRSDAEVEASLPDLILANALDIELYSRVLRHGVWLGATNLDPY